MKVEKKWQVSIAFEHFNKKIKVPQEIKLVKEKDDIVTAVPQVSNSNATVTISSPYLEAQVKK